MIEVGEDTVEFEEVGIPPTEQCHLHDSPREAGEPAWCHAVDTPHGNGDGEHLHPAPHHTVGMGEPVVHEEHEDEGGEEVDEHYPFECHQSLNGFLLEPEQLAQPFHHSHLFSLYHCTVRRTPSSRSTWG